METRTARIELSTKVTSNLLWLFVEVVLGDRLRRQAERHPHPRDVPRRILGCFRLQVTFPASSVLKCFSGMDMDLSGAGGLSRP